MSLRLIGRFLQLGSTEELYARRATLIQAGTSNVSPHLGKPVPVVFGTRAVGPVVTAWRGRVVGTYSNQSDLPPQKRWYNTQTFAWRSTPPTGSDEELSLWQPMYELSMRMVMCVGPVDSIEKLVVGGVRAAPWQTNYAIPGIPGRRWNADNYRRYFTSLSDLSLFGGPEGDGGIGFRTSAISYARYYQPGAEFFLCFGMDERGRYIPFSISACLLYTSPSPRD